MSTPFPPEALLGVGAVSRIQVETRILDIPMHPDEFALRVRPGQTAAFPKGLKIVERFSASNLTRERGYREAGHRPFVRLHLERRTKTGRVTRVGDQSVDIQGLRDWIEGTGDYAGQEPRRRVSMPTAARIFEETTVADLVRLSDAAMRSFRGVQWTDIATIAEEQR